MIVRPTTSKDLPAWEHFVFEHPLAGPYHRFAWMRAVEESYGFRAAPLLAEQDGNLTGILPLTRMRAPFSHPKYVSLPYCDAAGPLAYSTNTEQALLDAAERLAKKSFGATDIRSMYPFGGVPASRVKVRMVLDLPGSSEELLAGFKAKVRNQVKKPAREGLTFALGGEELFREFYSVWSENMRDLGSPAHSARFMKNIAVKYGADARIGVVRKSDGVPAAAGMVLAHAKTMYIPWASSLRNHNRSNPNMLLYWGFLSHAANTGFSCFDFGRSTPGGGTYRFKKQWGAGPASLYWSGNGHGDAKGPNPSDSSLKKALFGSAWSRLPVAVSVRIGPIIRKRIAL